MFAPRYGLPPVEGPRTRAPEVLVVVSLGEVDDPSDPSRSVVELVANFSTGADARRVGQAYAANDAGLALVAIEQIARRASGLLHIPFELAHRKLIDAIKALAITKTIEAVLSHEQKVAG